MDAPQQQTSLTAEVKLTPEVTRQLATSISELALAKECFPVVDSPEVADLAGQHLVGLRTRYKLLDEMRKAITRPAREIIETAQSWFMPGLNANKEADGYISGKLSGWELEQRRQAEDALRKAQEAARAERARAEAALAAERAKAEAEARRLEAEAKNATDAEAAAKARILSEHAALSADAAAQAQQELALAPLPVVQVEEPRAIAGIGMADHWDAEPVLNWDHAKERIVAACGQCPELLALLQIDQPAVRKLAGALKTAFNVPGLRAVNRPVARRKAK